MLSLRIARRYLFTRKRHNAVNIISMVALGGVAVAAMAMVAVMSVFNGFSDIAESRLSLINPPLVVKPESGKVIANADSLARRLEQLPQVAAAMPVVTEQGLAIFSERQMAVTLMGVPDGWGDKMQISRIVIDGENLTDQGYATLAVGPAIHLGARPDPAAPLQLYLPRRLGRFNPANPLSAFAADTICMAAVYQTDRPNHDEDHILVPLNRLRDMLQYDGGEASQIMLLPAEGVTVSRLRRAVAPLTSGCKLLTRQEQEEKSFRMIRIEKWISFLMLVFILIIASFNIISTLSLIIIEKKSSISILKALGATRRVVNRIFIWQGMLITLVGGVAGVALGSALTLAQQWGGFIRLGGDPERMSITVYPVRLDPMDLLVVIGIVAAVGAATGLLTLAIKKAD